MGAFGSIDPKAMKYPYYMVIITAVKFSRQVIIRRSHRSRILVYLKCGYGQCLHANSSDCRAFFSFSNFFGVSSLMDRAIGLWRNTRPVVMC